MTNDPWTDVPRGGGNFWKPETIGDQITGTITDVGVAPDFNGNICPKIVFETADGERTVTAGQANLKRQLLALEPTPKPGDKMRITYTGNEKMARGEMKVFVIEVKAGEPVKSSDLF